MPITNVNNVDVDFPFVPYKCQEDYMGHVIKALQQKSNAILESPTGTGKTLCLLCSVLAWRLTYIAKLQLNGLSTKVNIDMLDKAAGDLVNSEAYSAIPKIIYASRTHSQISQVVKELKNTIYKPKICVLGSRDQLCLHPKVMNIENSMAKIHTCRGKIKERSCVHYTNVERKINDPIFNEIMDIEDLVKVSQDKTMCPYFTSRELLKAADIIFMPYNYLIDHQTRKNQSIKLENSIIIVDEAHNIERVCEDSYSFEITSLDIANCIENCQLALQRILDDGGSDSAPTYNDSSELNKDDVLTMKAIFLSLEREFNKLEVKGEGGIIDKSTFKNLLASINVNDDTKNLITEVLTKMEAVLSMSSSNKIVGNTYVVLNNFMQILELTLNQNANSNQQYVCYISKERKRDTGKWKPKNWTDKMESIAPIHITKLSYWCFSPGIAMEEFVKQRVYSIILTSGTLSPLSSFSAELKIPFPITLQNPHVISPEQISVQVLCRGCDGEELLSTYKNRSNPKYLCSLGNTIVNFLRIIPHGVLVFFPSYFVMDTCIKFWQDKGIYDRILKIKSCFVEPKSKKEMAQLMIDFDARVRDPVDKTTGAILFAVCRGKASEGIDFSDMHGRGVIITGLPFPPKVDPKINAKINFLDQQRRLRHNGLNGNDWYIQQSSRAVNQAVGRVIRHKDDFGAVIFLDKRFSYQSNIDELPKWTQSFVKVNEKFGSSLREVAKFFKLYSSKVSVQPEISEPEPTKNNKGRLSSMYKNFIQKRIEEDKYDNNIPDSTLPQDLTPPPRKILKPDKRASLVTSLNNAVSSDFAFPASLSPISTKTSSTDYVTPEIIRNPKKRIRLIAPSEAKSKQLFPITHNIRVTEKEKCSSMLTQSTITSSTQGTLITSTQKTTSTKTQIEADPEKVAESKRYSTLLKDSLNKEEYGRFRRIIQEYRKVMDINILISNVKDLFSERSELLLGFRVFLKSHHKDIFDKAVGQ